MGWTVGITGIIGSGKSTVSRYIADQGYPVLGADEVAKDLMTSNAALMEEIRAIFGPSAYQGDGTLNRSWIADMAFSQPEKLAQLNGAVHPRVREHFTEQTSQFPASELVFWDVPLLFEGDMWEKCRSILLVVADFEVRLKRALKAGKFSREDFIRRDKEQIPLKEKENKSDYIIDNSADLEATHRQIDRVLAKLKKKAAN